MLNPTIEEVLKFATDAHYGQNRDQGVPYIEHPKSVAQRLREYGFTDFVHQSVALLHDVIEDCNVSCGKISDLFGSDIAISVEQLTNIHPAKTSFAIKHKTLIEHAKNEMFDISKRVKIVDRIDNLNDMCGVWENWKQRRYASAAIELAEALKPIPDDTVKMHSDLIDLAKSFLED